MNVDEVLEAATADFFWVPAFVKTVERPELAYSYTSTPSSDFTRVVRTRPMLAEPQRLIDEVLEAHRGGASQWTLNSLSDTPAMRRALEDAGYEEGHRNIAYVVQATDYRRLASPKFDLRQVETIAELKTLHTLWEQIFGHAPKLSDTDLAAELDTCTGPARRVARFIAYHQGEPAGTGGMDLLRRVELCPDLDRGRDRTPPRPRPLHRPTSRILFGP